MQLAHHRYSAAPVHLPHQDMLKTAIMFLVEMQNICSS